MKRRNDKDEAEALTFNMHANLPEDALEPDDEKGVTGSCDSQHDSDSTAKIFAMAQKFPRLEKSLEAKLICDAKAGSNYARNTLTKHNFHVLVDCARGYAQRYGWHYFQDLFHEGAEFFSKIISTFDPEQASLETYARLCLRTRMQEYIDKHEQSVRDAKRLRKVNRQEQILGRELAVIEIMSHLNVGMDIAKRIKQLKSSKQTIGNLENADENVLNLIVDEKVDTESLAQSHELSETMLKAFSYLSPVQLSVIRLRYGFEPGNEKKTYEEIARTLGLGHRKAAERADKRALKVLGKHLKGWED